METVPEGSTSTLSYIPSHSSTSLSIQSGTRVLVSGLPSDVTGSQLHELFDQTVSQVQQVDVYCDTSGVSRGIALIEFLSLEAALRAHHQFHGKLIDKVSTITVEIVAIPASPALDRAGPFPPASTAAAAAPSSSSVRTTTIQPPAHFAQQQEPPLPPPQQSQQHHPHHRHSKPSIPLAPRSKNYTKARPPASKLSLKQRLALPSPPPPRRFLFTTPASGPKGPKATQKKGKPAGKQKAKPFLGTSGQARKPRHSKPAQLQP